MLCILIENIKGGHLWQDRYKSKYVISENYLYTLIKYIEHNPIEANITEAVSSYPHTLSYKIFKGLKYYPCCNNSILIKEFDIKTLSEFINKKITKEELELLESKEKIEKKDNEIKILKEKDLKEYFNNKDSKDVRNLVIIKAFMDGHTQIEIANHLNLSKSSVSKIIKSGDSTSGVR